MPNALLLEATKSGGSSLSLLILPLIMVAMYYLMIRPQRRRAKEGLMASYNLQSNEVVLLKDDSVYQGKKLVELILTNLNLVVVSKSVFLKPSASQTFPINQIKIYNGRAHAIAGVRGGMEVLGVYFVHGEEEFRFLSDGKKKIQTWIGKINEAVTGEPAVEAASEASAAASGADRVAGALKDVMGAYKSFRGQKPATPVPEAPIRVAAKCVSCGAPVNGVKGQTITCTYCNAAQQL